MAVAYVKCAQAAPEIIAIAWLLQTVKRVLEPDDSTASPSCRQNTGAIVLIIVLIVVLIVVLIPDVQLRQISLHRHLVQI